jgi:hypothetical protein
MKLKPFEPQFGTIYLGYNPNSGKTEPFRYLGWVRHMKRPYNDRYGDHCGVWILHDNQAGQCDEIEPITAKWLNRTIKGMQKQINNRQKKLDIYNNLAILVV